MTQLPSPQGIRHTSFEGIIATALTALALSACEKPPVKEMAAAESVLTQARADEAERYAPDRLKEAEATFAEAQKKVQDKDYRGAVISAAEATEKARSASKAAGSAKTVAQSTTQVAVAEIRAALDEIAGIREEARKSKAPDAIFEGLQLRAEEAERAVQDISALVEKGNFLEAQKAATALRGQAVALPRLWREALDQWQATHGRKARVRK